MVGVHKLYLGWQNPRGAYLFHDQDIVVLIEGDSGNVLTENLAKNFRAKHKELTDHLCGIRQTIWSVAILAEHPGEKSYNVLFEEYFT